MVEKEQALRIELVRLAKSLFDKGLSSGSAGNISVKLDEETFLATPTNSSLGFLDPATLSKVNRSGETLSGLRASKEVLMHLAFYQQRPDVGAIVHLHSPYLTAYSCLANLDPTNALPAITPYFVMRVGKLPLVPYIHPGSPLIAEAVLELAPTHQAILLANHGPVVAGKDLTDAVYNAEELEESAKLFFILKGSAYTGIDAHKVAELEMLFPKTIPKQF